MVLSVRCFASKGHRSSVGNRWCLNREVLSRARVYGGLAVGSELGPLRHVV